MSVYANFGYSLPRVAADQANAGTKVSTSSLQPGDLLFYHGYGHVAIYIGGGQVVHASNAKSGIKISNYDYSPIDKAVRIVK
jgi:cell wall-associated NlpC family hydrolase